MGPGSDAPFWPKWVRPPGEDVALARAVAWRHHQSTGDDATGGVFTALNWLDHNRPQQTGPVTERPLMMPEARRGMGPDGWRIGADTRLMARAESWAALCGAAGQGSPPGTDWRALAIPEPDEVEAAPRWCFGAWRALAWALGVHPDPPIELPARRSDGTPEPTFATRPDPDSPAWREAQLRRTDAEQAEATRWWRHTRTLVDRQQSATG